MGSYIFQKSPFVAQKLLSHPALLYLQNVGFNNADLSFLEGKVICIEIIDLKLRQLFGLRSNNIELLPESEAADVTFKGQFSSFIKLLTQSTDPDTLFFQRKLSISGDTEIGLEVKALFEQLEFENFSLPIKKSILILQQYV